jgi:hypothetical protein
MQCGGQQWSDTHCCNHCYFTADSSSGSWPTILLSSLHLSLRILFLVLKSAGELYEKLVNASQEVG